LGLRFLALAWVDVVVNPTRPTLNTSS